MRTTLGAVLGWVGTPLIVVLEDVNKFLAFACGLTTLVATIYAVRVARANIRAKKIALAMDERKLCEDCLNGKPPSLCPLPPEERPQKCPLKNS